MDTKDLIRQLTEPRDKIDAVIELLTGLDGTGTRGGFAPTGRKGGRRKISAEARARIAEAQRRRWAKARAKNA